MPLKHVVLCLSLAAVSALNALSLKDGVEESLSTNPVVVERLNNYRATLEDLRSSEAGYLPTLDWMSGYGFERTKSPSTNFENRNYNVYEHSLLLTQNIFNGLGTKYQIDYQKARLLAAANHFVEKSNDVAFNFIRSYIDVLKNKELLEIAKENIKFNEDIFAKVSKLYKAGLTTRSEAEKSDTSYSLAKSNLIVAQNNLADSLFSLQRILGRNIFADELEKIAFDSVMPSSLEEMNEYAITHNPSILVSQYNIKAAQALWNERQKNYYPKIDFTARQSYSNNISGIEGRDDRFRAMITLSYNLYRGGADEAEVKKNISKIHQEHQIKNDLKRQVIEQGQLSWSANKFLGEQLTHLEQYKKTSEKTVELYQKEYDMGRRTLLDLLVAENDFIASKTQITKAEHDRLFSKFRILDAMGIMVTTVVGSKVASHTAKVGLKPIDIDINKDKKFGTVIFSNRDSIERKQDKLPVNTDSDNDSISDAIDQCDNSVGPYVTIYGCNPQAGKEYPSKIFRSVDKKDFDVASSYIKQNRETIRKVVVKTHSDPYTYDEDTLKNVKDDGVKIAEKLKNSGVQDSKITLIAPVINEAIVSSEKRVGEEQNFRADILIFNENK